MEQKIFIGTSGWQYSHWKGIFYPQDLQPSEWLKFYCNHLSTVEINATFYRDVKASTFLKWYSLSPDGFLFSVKIHRLITHYKKLKVDRESIFDFLNRVVNLKEKLAIILIQLPPSLKFDISLIKDFLSILDKTFRYTIEVRNKTFIDDLFFDTLRENNIALCISDSAGRYPYFEIVTADFIYIRLHGSQKLYASKYTDEELFQWSQKIRSWNKTTYIYFDNDYMGHAIKNALDLRRMLMNKV